MATAAQYITNKENAQHSTGPRTEEGKKKSSLNAIRHGLTGQTVVLPNEDPGRYVKFREALYKQLAPLGTVELMLAQTICDTQWRLERAGAREANILAMSHLEPLPDHIIELDIPEVRTAMIEVISSERHEPALRNLHLLEVRLNRNLYRAMDKLEALQDRRKQAEQEAMEEAVTAYMFHKQNRLTFNPSEFGFVFTSAEIARAATRHQWQKQPKRGGKN